MTDHDNAADALAELTGEDREEFDASEYEIPVFEEQEMHPADSGGE